MANTKISNLPAAASLTGSDLMPVVQSGVTKKGTFDQIPFLQAGAGAVARTAQAKMRDVVSVKDFGAVGDGVADDYAAIMAAYNALPAAGGVINLGRGQFLFKTAILFTKPTTLIGEGYAILPAPTVAATELIKDSTVSGTGITLRADACSLRNLSVRGLAGNTGDGVAIQAGRCLLRDVSVFSMGNDGIRIGTDSAGYNQNLWCLDNVKSKSNGRHGVFLNDKIASLGSSDAGGGTLLHSDLQFNTSVGLCIGNAQLNTFVGNVCQQNTVAGVYIDAGGDLNTFIGGDVEANTTDFFTHASVYGTKVFGGTYTGVISDSSATTSWIGAYTQSSQYGNGGIKLANLDIGNTKVLDWYDEVDFSSSVALIGGSTAGVGTYSVKSAFYTRIGNTIHFGVELTWSAHTGTGQMFVSGLPFAGGARGKVGGMTLILENITYGAGIPVAYLANADSKVGLYLQTSAGALSAITMDTAGTIVLNGTYMTDS